MDKKVLTGLNIKPETAKEKMARRKQALNATRTGNPVPLNPNQNPKVQKIRELWSQAEKGSNTTKKRALVELEKEMKNLIRDSKLTREQLRFMLMSELPIVNVAQLDDMLNLCFKSHEFKSKLNTSQSPVKMDEITLPIVVDPVTQFPRRRLII